MRFVVIFSMFSWCVIAAAFSIEKMASHFLGLLECDLNKKLGDRKTIICLGLHLQQKNWSTRQWQITTFCLTSSNNYYFLSCFVDHRMILNIKNIMYCQRYIPNKNTSSQLKKFATTLKLNFSLLATSWQAFYDKNLSCKINRSDMINGCVRLSS